MNNFGGTNGTLLRTTEATVWARTMPFWNAGQCQSSKTLHRIVGKIEAQMAQDRVLRGIYHITNNPSKGAVSAGPTKRQQMILRLCADLVASDHLEAHLEELRHGYSLIFMIGRVGLCLSIAASTEGLRRRVGLETGCDG